MKTKLLVILLILLCITPVMAVTYPEEYYSISERLSLMPDYNDQSVVFSPLGVNQTNWDVVQFLQMKQQNILLEKQNEILSEGVKAQWVETCYRSIYSGHGNLSAWQSKCANAGYPV